MFRAQFVREKWTFKFYCTPYECCIFIANSLETSDVKIPVDQLLYCIISVLSSVQAIAYNRYYSYRSYASRCSFDGSALKNFYNSILSRENKKKKNRIKYVFLLYTPTLLRVYYRNEIARIVFNKQLIIVVVLTTTVSFERTAGL